MAEWNLSLTCSGTSTVCGAPSDQARPGNGLSRQLPVRIRITNVRLFNASEGTRTVYRDMCIIGAKARALHAGIMVVSEKWQEILKPEDREALGGLLAELFDRWEIPNDERAALVGPRGENAALLLSIHRQLRMLFPQNPRLRYGWMTASNRDFQGRSPIEYFHHAGPDSLVAILHYLECAVGDGEPPSKFKSNE